jgi:hypothetical protein
VNSRPRIPDNALTKIVRPQSKAGAAKLNSKKTSAIVRGGAGRVILRKWTEAGNSFRLFLDILLIGIRASVVNL